MKSEKIKKYFYAKGVFVGIMSQNIFLLIILIIISTKDGFEFFGLFPIWSIIIMFSLASTFYFYSKSKKQELKMKTKSQCGVNW
jgi:hypothetical protein